MALEMALKREQTRTRAQYPAAHLVVREVNVEGEKARWHICGYADQEAYRQAMADKGQDGPGGYDWHNAVIFEDRGEVENLAMPEASGNITLTEALRQAVQQHLLTTETYADAMEVEG